MTAAKIIKRDVKGNCVFHVRQGLAVGVGEPRKGAEVHLWFEFATFVVRRRNAAVARLSIFDMWDRSDTLAPAVPAIGIQLAVDFVKLAEVYVLTEMFPH